MVRSYSSRTITGCGFFVFIYNSGMMKKLFLLYVTVPCLLLSACNLPLAAPTPSPVPTNTALPFTSTPQPTATFTETPEPTATASPAPTDVPMYFRDEFTADLGAWTSFQTGGAETPSIIVDNEALRVDFLSSDTWHYSIHNSHEYDRVMLRAKVRGTGGSAGLVCFYSDADGWYEFNIGSDATYSILYGKKLADGAAQYLPIANGIAGPLQPGGLDHEIGLECGAERLNVYIDGKIFRNADVTRLGLTSGRIGVSAASFGDVPSSVLFDWIEVGP